MTYINGAFSIVFRQFAEFLPNFIGGFLIITIGVVLSSIVSHIMFSLFRFFRLSAILSETKLMTEREVALWERIFSAVVRISVIITFLIPAFDVWGLSRVITVLSELLLYTPNLIIAIVLAFIGLLGANLLADFVGGGKDGAPARKELQIGIKGIILFFTALVVLSQIGIAGEFVGILFTGIVMAVSLAVGIAFGLGGQGIAKDILSMAIRRVQRVQDSSGKKDQKWDK